MSPRVLKSLATETGAIRTCFLQFLSLNVKSLLQMYVRATAKLHQNVAHYGKMTSDEAQNILREKND